MLEFANDTLLFYQVTIHNILLLKSILRYFEIASGVEINFHNRKDRRFG